MTRIAIGGIWHETNTFCATPTTTASFEAYQLTTGPELVERNRGVGNEMGGFIAGCEARGSEVVPTLFAAAVPSGTAEARTYERLKRSLLDAIPTDVSGVLLAPHGAMVAEACDDVEADLLEAVRGRIGARPLVATYDLHANISARAARIPDVWIGYDTYPHVDVFDRAVEAADVLHEVLAGKVAPQRGFAKTNLLTSPQAQGTQAGPMCEVMDVVRELESSDDLLCVSVAPGFPYADVERLGLAVTAYATSRERADGAARAVAERAWSLRDGFAVRNASVTNAVERALSSQSYPVVLVDAADNIGGGAPGDGTTILAELLRRRAVGSVATLTDPAAVAACVRAGVRNVVDVVAGGRTDDRHGPPVRVRGLVRTLSDGVYAHRGPYMPGQRADMGRTAVVDCGGVEVVLMERAMMPFDAEQLSSLGIDPARRRILIVKSATAWRSAYGDIAAESIVVDTPGICSSDLAAFSYTKRRDLYIPA